MEQGLYFDKENVQTLTLENLTKTIHENYSNGLPCGGIYHFELIGLLLDHLEHAGFKPQVTEIFAANNKETNRKHSDSRVSERALREIYLKAFEIIVKEADPWTIMSAYNAVNGQRASESKDLLTGILRDEWGFKGMVTSDWWNRAEQYKEILAGNDVKMANGYPDRVRKAMEMGAIHRSDLEICAKRVLMMILKLD